MHPLIKQCQTQWTMKFITFLALQPGIIWRVHGREEGLVYLMLRPIAQCQADAGGNFRKAVARGNPSKRQRAVSAISKAGEAWSKAKRGRNDNSYSESRAGSTDFWTFGWDKLQRSQPACRARSTCRNDQSWNFWIISLCIFSEPACMVTLHVCKLALFSGT